jgi:inner membrane protein
MDPLTQGALGAVLPQATAHSRQAASAGLLGFFAGMAADLDVLMRSSVDPLLFLEFHRHFTHSLVFIPIGGLLCAVVLHALLGRRRGLSFRQSWVFCTLGYATHGLLDACTSYGTLLLWPFSDERFAFSTISIIDPLFTLPLLVAVVFAARRKNVTYARLGLLWAVGYMALGQWQRNEAMDMGYALAAAREHTPQRLAAKPSFANILVWKIVYETGDRYHVDAVRATLAPRVFEGVAVQKLDVDRDMPWLEKSSQQATDIERFRWFSNGYIARDPVDQNRVIDIRYSMVPNEVSPLWSIELQPDAPADQHASFLNHPTRDAGATQRLWHMLSGR